MINLAQPLSLNGYLNHKSFNGLNGIRGLSILIVIIAHQQFVDNIPVSIVNNIRYFLHDGKLGVRVFFVLSGFLITSLLIKEQLKNGKINLRKFYMRRFLRIVPAFIFFLFIAYLINYYYQLDINNGAFIGAFLYLSNFPFFPKTFILAHTWSLSVEEQYYLIWPTIFKFFCDKVIYIAIAIICLNPFSRVLVYLHPEYQLYTLSPLFNLAEPIIIGSIGALLYAKKLIPISFFLKNPNLYLLVFTFIFWLIEHAMYNGQFGKVLLPFGSTLSSLSILLVLLISANCKPILLLNNSFLNYQAKISYSLYLWQQLFVFSDKFYDVNYIWWNKFPFNIIGIFTMAILSYYLIELYFLKFKTKFNTV
ncbi:acyltransferase family protein [Pedobacter cryophilus]|uniref:Acyltransferase n=1 Tax=Pedobacter cryophilus TaxID=2571271 RepID=A0A4U1C5K7_9SPHI|nr:acyltransferase [Pedobacter cryophilus]TKB98630.1 acyltransferase [Pedobacter cryophilus]